VKNCPLLKEEQEADSPGNRAANRLGTVLVGVSQGQRLRLREIQPRRMKGLRKRMHP